MKVYHLQMSLKIFSFFYKNEGITFTLAWPYTTKNIHMGSFKCISKICACMLYKCKPQNMSNKNCKCKNLGAISVNNLHLHDFACCVTWPFTLTYATLVHVLS
jgi:hypothetical protein